MTDRSTTHWAGIGLVVFLLMTLCFIGALAMLSRAIPDVLPQLGRDALIGLLGLLAKSPVDGQPQAVQVVNRADNAVPVDPT
jgi:hypothetical protein